MISKIKENNDDNSNFEELEYTEDGTKDMLDSIEEELFKFIQREVESLDLPEGVKKVLKTLEGTINFIRIIKNLGQN